MLFCHWEEIHRLFRWFQVLQFTNAIVKYGSYTAIATSWTWLGDIYTQFHDVHRLIKLHSLSLRTLSNEFK